jgi:2-polyprenyl-3-methyl-5-hydroxy-6-metoxy-1,4-benzoquinol methylase
MSEISEAALTNAGERMTVGNMWGYWAHLSIYRFAIPYAQGKRILDAGSGSGYGAAYLARYGADVLALDAGSVAIEHSRQRYAGDAVTFEVADLNSRLPVGDEIFDLVFSSNVFEHIANVDGLAAECTRVIKPGGVVIIAVPPICSAAALAADMDNQFHVNHIPPTAWAAKLSRFFSNVECHAHFGTGEFSSQESHHREIRLTPDKVTIRETDFDFPKMAPEEMMIRGTSITAVFVCRGPKAIPDSETVIERTPTSWSEGEVAARKIGEMQAAIVELKAKIARLRSRSINGRLRSLRKAFGLK